MAGERKTVPLVRPFDIHGQTFRSLVLKEPTGGLYVKHGDPFITIWTASGSGYQVEQPDVIQAYLEELLVNDDGLLPGYSVVNLLGVEDTMALKEALFSFFTEAAARRAATRLTGSSSTSAS
jgi:hypothetical protein